MAKGHLHKGHCEYKTTLLGRIAGLKPLIECKPVR